PALSPAPWPAARVPPRPRFRVASSLPSYTTATESVPAKEMQRVCFLLQVKPERIPEYRERHAAVWQEMRAALSAAGWRNYSLFLSPTGMVVGYLETDDFDAARQAMAKTDVNARWQAEM